jgi:RIO kinase 1
MSFDDDLYDLSRPAFKRGQLAAAEQQVLLREFDGWISAVTGRVNDGKEATVYLCQALPGVCETGAVVAKMYRARKFRAFATDSHYVNPRKMRDRRLARAMQQRTRKGLHVGHHHWIEREWRALETLHAAGASVPRPIAHCADGILMEFIGRDGVRAPALAEIRLSRDDAERAFAAILDDVRTLLACGLVHGDLSAYNILWADGTPRLIDLPQSVHVDEASDAWSLFVRDVNNLCRYFERCAIDVDPAAIARQLWAG